MIERSLLKKILANCTRQKVTILVGARRVGKTQILQAVRNEHAEKCLWLNGEDETTAKILADRSIADYQRLIQNKTLLVIDEAQYIPDIGRKVKLMIDEIKPLHIIITGSSSFDLQQQAGEPLVGRSITMELYPIAQMELAATENVLETKQHLPERLVYGSYPELFSTTELKEKQQYLRELVNTYLLKDILAFENIRSPQKIKDLLTLIAYQIGHEVSMDELGKNLGISKNTVDRYLDLLTKVFVVYKRSGFSRNLRKEIVKSSRWYFFDNGIRNALINNFSPLPLRQDVGMLWENYMLSERIKRNAYRENAVNSYFWRTYDQQEIDLVEESNNSLAAYEMKWAAQKQQSPVAFSNAYPKASFAVIHQDNYEPFIV